MGQTGLADDNNKQQKKRSQQKLKHRKHTNKDKHLDREGDMNETQDNMGALTPPENRDKVVTCYSGLTCIISNAIITLLLTSGNFYCTLM